MRIPNETVEQIRLANDIVDVIAAHVPLKKRGKNFVGLCPFHQEKTPSFTVSAEKQMYHCFGCGRGGNVFTFVMEFEKVSFVEAVRSLAQRAGIVLPESKAQYEQSSAIENLSNACRFAGLFFHHNLTKTDEGKTALEYFHARGFSDEIITLFGLGYALNSWDALLHKAHEEGIGIEYLLKAGLVRARDDGSGFYDYFRARTIFPILSTAGRVVGFGARKLRDDDPLGKYINSPETPIYNKSRILFGLFQAKEAIRAENSALMVEGYVDLITLFQAGFQNVVASSGTALTQEQLQLVGRYTKTMTLVYDADSAGSQATLRGVDLALEQDFDVRVVELPQGEDPDSFVRRYGAKAFRTLLDRAVSFIDYKANQFLKVGKLRTPEGQAESVRSIVQSIAKMKDELKRNFYIKHVAEHYGMYESTLYRELERLQTKDRKLQREVPEAQRVPLYDVPLSEGTVPKRTDISSAERDILKLFLEGSGDIIDFLTAFISPDELSDQRVQKAVRFILQRREAVGAAPAAVIVNELDDPELKSLISDLTLSKYELSKGWAEMAVEIEEPDPWKIARDSVVALKRQAVQREIEQNQRRLKDAVQRGQDSHPFVQRHQELLNLLKRLDSAEFFTTSNG
jgi:DNA primase